MKDNIITFDKNEPGKRRRKTALKSYGIKGSYGTLPIIQVAGRQLREVANDTVAALVKQNNPPSLFDGGGRLVRVRHEIPPRIDPLNQIQLRGYVARAVDYVRGKTACNPPPAVVKDILAGIPWEILGQPAPFPRLDGVVTAPCLLPDGTVLYEPGYDPKSGLYLALPPNLEVPPVSDAPTDSAIAAAVEFIDELLHDFPFAEDASAANARALLLTAAIRPSISGCAPLGIIAAPQAGTGKGLLADCASILATGAPANREAAPVGEAEWDRRIYASLRQGSPIILLDNLIHPLRAAALAMALTAEHYKSRILRSSNAPAVPQKAVWIATGNNVQLGGDMGRRVFWIRLDAEESEPWKRTDFIHADLLGWVKANRGHLLHALLTMARAWHAAGRPTPEVTPLGSFENWTTVVGGILQFVGIRGFLANSEHHGALADEDDAQWRAFLGVLVDGIGDGAFTVKDLVKGLDERDAWKEALPDSLTSESEGGGNLNRRIGMAFRTIENRRFGPEQYRLVRAGTHHHAVVWRVLAG